MLTSLTVIVANSLPVYWSMLEAGLAFTASQLPSLSQYLTHFSEFPPLIACRNALHNHKSNNASSPHRSYFGMKHLNATKLRDVHASEATMVSDLAVHGPVAFHDGGKPSNGSQCGRIRAWLSETKVESRISLLPVYTRGKTVRGDFEM